MAPPLLVLALELHRTPLRFGHLSDPSRALPAAFGDWLAESSGLFGTVRIGAAAEALGTDPESLRSAFLFLLRQVLLIPQADHYRVLGLSRSCPAEAVKQHHGLLMRLFHPDRAPKPDDRTAHLAARINGAYQVLRDPGARRRYDGQLPPLPEMEPADFFSPREPVPANSPASPAPALVSRRVGPALIVLGGLLIGALLWLGQPPGETRLRVNPQRASGAGSGPSYLREGPGAGAARPARPEAESTKIPVAQPVLVSPAVHGAMPTDVRRSGDPRPLAGDRAAHPGSPAVRDGQGSSEPVPSGEGAPRGRSPQVPAASEPPSSRRSAPGGAGPTRQAAKDGPFEAAAHPRVPQPSPDRRQPDAAARVLTRLEQTFAAGDLPGLVGLFTANAVVNGGTGARAIHRAYGATLSEQGQRRLILAGLRWQTLKDQRLLGRGTIRLSTRTGSKADWSGQSGPFEIELVPWMGDYKISRLIHPFALH